MDSVVGLIEKHYYSRVFYLPNTENAWSKPKFLVEDLSVFRNEGLKSSTKTIENRFYRKTLFLMSILSSELKNKCFFDEQCWNYQAHPQKRSEKSVSAAGATPVEICCPIIFH